MPGIPERRTPAKKKNRVLHGQALEETPEEDAATQPEAPSGKPPELLGETPRVQHLRKRVKDLSWNESAQTGNVHGSQDDSLIDNTDMNASMSIPSPPEQEEEKTPRLEEPSPPLETAAPVPASTENCDELQVEPSAADDPEPSIPPKVQVADDGPSTPPRTPPKTPPPRTQSTGSDEGRGASSEGSDPDLDKGAKNLKRKHLAREASTSQLKDGPEGPDAEPAKRAKDESGAKSPSRAASPQRAAKPKSVLHLH